MIEEDIVKNNIFSFATSELSQDAFICWCLNWINAKPEAPLRQLGIDLLKRLLPTRADEIQNIHRVIIMQQLLNIDILVLIPELKVALIIEDKTVSGAHDNQIYRYKYLLSESMGHSNESHGEIVPNNQKYDVVKAYSYLPDRTSAEKSKKEKKIQRDKNSCWGACQSLRWELSRIGESEDVSDYDIHVAYFKTNWFSDDDWYTVLDLDAKTDTYIDGPDFLNLLMKFHNCQNYVLSSFVHYLAEQICWNHRASEFWHSYDDINHHKRFNLQDSYISQRAFFQSVFNQPNVGGVCRERTTLPYETITFPWLYNRIDDSTKTRVIQHGSSFGTPWSLMQFWSRKLDRETETDYSGFNGYPESKLSVKPYMFWRIDRDKYGPVLVLRYYTWWEKGAGDNGENTTAAYKTRVFNYIVNHVLESESIKQVVDELNCAYKIDYAGNAIYNVGRLYKQYENNVFLIRLRPILETWTEPGRKEFFKETMRKLNDALTNVLENIDWKSIRLI